MKQCFKCGEVKILSDFYKHNGMKDGHLNKCKACAKSDVRTNREGKVEQYREYERGRAGDPKRVAARSAYTKTEAGKAANSKASKVYRDKFPTKYKAHNMVNNAIRDGKLFSEPCELCGEKAHAHHDDYAKPLNVRWLCPDHHKQWHCENGEGLNSI